MWAGCGTMGLCGWSGNSLFALQILQIFTMLGACSTPVVHTLVPIFELMESREGSEEEEEESNSEEEVWEISPEEFGGSSPEL